MYFPIFSCLLFLLRTTDCFQWSQLQQSSHVVSSYLGSNVTLSCDFVLSAQEKQEMQQFHVVLWSRQTHSPAPLSWQALASITNINNVLDSSSKIIYPDQNKFSLKNNSLTVFNIGIGDDSQYQCEVKSSFYTTPSVVKLNVLYKPLDTQLFASKTVLTNKEGFELNCTAHANPKAGYSFFLDGKLVQNSTSHHYVIDKADKQHQGEYTCVPWNYYGHGPNATVDIKVEGLRNTDTKSPFSDEIIAGITGAVALAVVIIVVLVIICKRLRADMKSEPAKSTSGSQGDATEAHIGPGIYGSEATINRSREEINYTQPPPQLYKLNGSTNDVPDMQM